MDKQEARSIARGLRKLADNVEDGDYEWVWLAVYKNTGLRWKMKTAKAPNRPVGFNRGQ